MKVAALSALIFASLPIAAALADVRPTSAVLLTPRVRPAAFPKSALIPAEVAKLGESPVVAYQHEGKLFIVARHEGAEPALSGTFRGRLQRIDDGLANLWGAAFEVDSLDRAILDIIVTADAGFVGYFQFRGSAAGPMPVDALRAGVMVRQTVTGAQSGLTRRIAIYRPRNSSRSSRMMYVLDLAESPDSFFRRVDALIYEQVISPVIIIALPAGDGISTVRISDMQRRSELRLQERVSGLNPAVYRRYEQFIFDDLAPALTREYQVGQNREQVAFVGTSASATWVLHQARHRPGEAGVWGAFSLPNNPVDRLPDNASERIFMGGGAFDLEYTVNGLARCTEILRLGGDCRFTVVNAGHSQSAWDELIADLLINWEDLSTREGGGGAVRP
jgi:hypothetical protein